MCDIADGYNDITNHEHRTARKEHVCEGCGETIRKGDTYHHTSALFDGHWSTWKHCERCNAMMQALFAEADDPIAIDPGLNCGETWESIGYGAPPEHVAALAFWLPGEPLPTKETTP